MINLPSLSHVHRWGLFIFLDYRLSMMLRQGLIKWLIIFYRVKRILLRNVVQILLLDHLLKLLMVEAGVVIGLVILLSEPR